MFYSKQQRILRALGFRNDQKGIMNRYLREDGGWNEHLRNTRAFILKSAQTKLKQVAVVLGSGWCLDVPVEELAAQFQQVYLVDLVHPKVIRHKIAKLRNVKIIEFDITGGMVEQAYELMQRYKQHKKNEPLSVLSPNIANFGLPQNITADFIVSVNILNQLDGLVHDYLQSAEIYSDIELQELRDIIQQAHINHLPANKTCLVTDFEEMIYDSKDNLEKTNPLVYLKLPVAKFSEQWLWHFDMQMRYYENRKTIFKVTAIDF